jgi:hypothetical protein
LKITFTTANHEHLGREAFLSPDDHDCKCEAEELLMVSFLFVWIGFKRAVESLSIRLLVTWSDLEMLFDPNTSLLALSSSIKSIQTLYRQVFGSKPNVSNECH